MYPTLKKSLWERLKEKRQFRRVLKKAKKGSARYQMIVGTKYLYGTGVEQNFDEALYWFSKATPQGDAYAFYYLGMCFENGYGTKKNLSSALSNYEEAAKRGCTLVGDAVLRVKTALGQKQDPKSLFDTAQKLYGNGEYADIKKALPYYTNAAQQGYVPAQNMLGYIYTNKEFFVDYDLAYAWSVKAANSGNANAQNRLGIFYENGYHVSKNITEALNWYRKAAAQGHKSAEEAVKKLTTKPATKPASTPVAKPTTTKPTTTKPTTAAKPTATPTAKASTPKPTATATKTANTVITASGKKYFPELTAFLNHLRSLQPSVMNNIYGLGSREDVKLLAQYGDGIVGAFKKYSVGNERENVTPQFFAALVQYTLRNIDPKRYDQYGRRTDSGTYLFACSARSGDYKVTDGAKHYSKANQWGERDNLFTVDDPKSFTVELSFDGTFSGYAFASNDIATGAYDSFMEKWGGIKYLVESDAEQRSYDLSNARRADDRLKYMHTKDVIKATVKRIVTYLWENVNVVSPVKFPIEQLDRNKFRWQTEYRRISNVQWTFTFPPEPR